MHRSQKHESTEHTFSKAPQAEKHIGQKEFIALVAFMISFVAMAIDTILPALTEISEHFQLANENDAQKMVSSIFVGLGFGMIVFGPISDSFGRKKPIFVGLLIFMLGSLLSVFSEDYQLLLLSRVVQGFGAAAIRVVSVAMVRDQFSGAKMAKVMSQIMIVFILVPAIAPSVGQAILYIGDWRDIFTVIMFLSFICLLWFSLRQNETLFKADRLKFSLTTIFKGVWETLTHKSSMGYTISSALFSGAFIAYVNSVHQIFAIQYKLGEQFPLYFGVLAIAIGFSSFVNSKLVEQWGMRKLIFIALTLFTSLAALFSIVVVKTDGHPPLALFMTYLIPAFFCVGILFGNFSSLAIEPLGHIAGVANSVISSLQTLIAVMIGSYIGSLYDGTVGPVVFGFLICGLSSLLLSLLVYRYE